MVDGAPQRGERAIGNHGADTQAFPDRQQSRCASHGNPVNPDAVRIHVGTRTQVRERSQDVLLLMEAQRRRFHLASAGAAKVEEQTLETPRLEVVRKVQQAKVVRGKAVQQQESAGWLRMVEEPPRETHAVGGGKGKRLQGRLRRGQFVQPPTAVGVNEALSRARGNVDDDADYADRKHADDYCDLDDKNGHRWRHHREHSNEIALPRS